MTLCRKCGKEIPDGQELCEYCQNTSVDLDQTYLDELMKNMDDNTEEEPEFALEEPTEEEPELALEEPKEEEPEFALEEPTEEDTSEAEEDINHLLDMLSDDYVPEEEKEEDVSGFEREEIQDEPLTASLFSEEDAGVLFADSLEENVEEEKTAATMDDVFKDALSAVEYSEKETMEESPTALDPFGTELDFIGGETLSDNDSYEEETVSPVNLEKITKKEKKKTGIWKRLFGNVITDQTAEAEAKERAEELAKEEAAEKLKAEKKLDAEVKKEEKEKQAEAIKAQKATAKAEKMAAKSAQKQEKKRLRLEREANEVVGKINPVGAAIVMVFFGILCLFVVFGTQIYSYSKAVNQAEDCFIEGNYEDAYRAIAGVDVSESSEKMADQVRICMQLKKEMNSYDNYYKMRMYLEALDSLMKGVRSYDENRDKADEYGILNQYNALESEIVGVLASEFGLDEEEARKINNSNTQLEYTKKLQEIVDQWIEKLKEDER